MVLNEEQRLLQSTIRDFLNQRAPVSALRELRDNPTPQGFDTSLWRELVDLGVSSIVLSEAHGGFGFGWMGLGAVMEEIGRHLTATPIFSSVVIGAALIEAADDHHSTEVLPEVVAGTRTLAFACDEGLRFNPGATATLLNQGVLQGEKSFVLNGSGATDFLVLARTATDTKGIDGLSLILVPRDAVGVTVNAIHSVDGHNFARVKFDQVAVDHRQFVGAPDHAWDFVSGVLDRATLALAAEMLGYFPDADGVMFIFLSYEFIPKVAVGGMGTAGIKAYVNMRLYNKEGKKVFNMREGGTSKKTVAMIKGIPVMKPAEITPMCLNATEKLVKDLNKKVGKLAGKADKKL